MDIFIHVPRVNVDEIATKSTPVTTSLEYREQVIHAREKQLLRLREAGKTSNAEMSNKDIDTFCAL
jgi:predicted ATPase with chaperone activity